MQTRLFPIRQSSIFNFQSSILLILLLSLALLAFVPLAQAQDTLNFNVADGDWNTAGSWDPAQVPTSADTVYINSSRTATIPSGYDAEASGLNIGINNTYGTLTINGSLTTIGDIRIAFNTHWMNNSEGTIDQSANSTVDVGGSLSLGGGSGDHGGVATGTYIQGANSSLTVVGSLNVQKGTYTASETSALTVGANVNVAASGKGNGTFTYSNTTDDLEVSGNVTVASTGHWNSPSTGIFNQSANTTVRIAGTLLLGGGGGDINSGSANGTYNLGSGARLDVGGTTAIGVPTTGKLNINGGTIAFAGNISVGGSGQLNHNSGAVHLPRLTTMNGSFTNDTGSLHFGVGGDPASGAFDKVTVSGGTMYVAGELRVDMEGGYKPEQTNSYTIITRTGGVLWGTFANAPVSGRRYRLGGMEALVTYGGDSVVLSEWREAPDGILLIVR